MKLHAKAVCAREIKIIHENIEGERDKDFRKAEELLQSAFHIYFLGFGYGGVNVTRLNIASLDNGRSRGTGLNLSAAEIRDIVRLIQGKVIVHQDFDCMRLLREYPEWD
jgi:hypothetical protein